MFTKNLKMSKTVLLCGICCAFAALLGAPQLSHADGDASGSVNGTSERASRVRYSDDTDTIAIFIYFSKGTLFLSGIPKGAGTYKLGSFPRGGKKPMVQAWFRYKGKGDYNAWCSENSRWEGDGTGYVSVTKNSLDHYNGDFRFRGYLRDKEASYEIAGSFLRVTQ